MKERRSNRKERGSRGGDEGVGKIRHLKDETNEKTPIILRRHRSRPNGRGSTRKKKDREEVWAELKQ